MKRNHKISYLMLITAAILALSGCGTARDTSSPATTNADSYSDTTDTGQEATNTNSEQPSGQEAASETKGTDSMIIEKGKSYTAVLHTDAGDIEIALAADKTPITANNFVSLSKKNFYNNTVFHRAIKGFMIQGGDPSGDGTGGPGYKFDDEPFEGEYTRGTAAMANAGPNTNGSQFFIMHADYPLPKNYVIFGQVTKGMEAVDKIAEAPVVVSASGEMSKPVTPVVVKSVYIVEK